MITRALPFADYLALTGVHFSTLRHVETSAMHYRRAVADEGKKDATPLRLGRAVHAMVLTPDEPPDVVVYPGAVRRGKAWDAFELANKGKLIIRAGELTGSTEMRAAVYSHPKAHALLSRGEGEVTVQWEEMGLPCRGRVDWLRDGGVVELKTTRSIAPRSFMREFAARYYHAQLAFYAMGVEAATGERPGLPTVIAVESAPPYDVCVYRIHQETIDAGLRKVDAWLRVVAECTASGRWPGVGGEDGEVDMDLPAWAESDGLPDVDMGEMSEGEAA